MMVFSSFQNPREVKDHTFPLFYFACLGKASEKKIRDYLGIFPNIGGGLLNPKTFVILTIALKTPLKHLKTP